MNGLVLFFRNGLAISHHTCHSPLSHLLPPCNATCHVMMQHEALFRWGHSVLNFCASRTMKEKHPFSLSVTQSQLFCYSNRKQRQGLILKGSTQELHVLLEYFLAISISIPRTDYPLCPTLSSKCSYRNFKSLLPFLAFTPY
jgi:hypothetical protein